MRYKQTRSTQGVRSQKSGEGNFQKLSLHQGRAILKLSLRDCSEKKKRGLTLATARIVLRTCSLRLVKARAFARRFATAVGTSLIACAYNTRQHLFPLVFPSKPPLSKHPFDACTCYAPAGWGSGVPACRYANRVHAKNVLDYTWRGQP